MIIPMIQAIDHINIVVSNLERSVRFYTGILGFTETKRARLEGDWIGAVVGLKHVIADVAYIVAPAGEPRIELLCYQHPVGIPVPENSVPNTIGLRHVAFRVYDLENIAQKLKDAGVSTFGNPVRVPASAVRHSAGNKSLLYFLDPDGVVLELAEYT